MLLASIPFNLDKVEELGDKVSKIVDQYFSSIGGGVVLGIIIVIVTFSLIKSPRNR